MTAHRRRLGPRVALALLLIAAACSSTKTLQGSPTSSPTGTTAAPAEGGGGTSTSAAGSTTSTTPGATTSSVPTLSCPGGTPGVVQQGDGLTTPCDAVKTAQTLLVKWNYVLEIDGKFGPGTAAAVKAFQTAHGLPSSGKVDGATYGALSATPPAVVIDLMPKGLGAATFANSAQAVIDYLTVHLGAITHDSGWAIAELTCTYPSLRNVTWENLTITLGRDGSKRDFVFYIYSDSTTSSAPTSLKTNKGLKITDTVARLMELYPGATVSDSEIGGGRIYDTPGPDGPFGAIKEGTPERIASIEAGIYPCGE